MNKIAKALATMAGMVATVTMMTGCEGSPTTTPTQVPTSTTSQTTSTQAQEALSRLAGIKVDMDPYTGSYDREGQFGEAWLDMDANHCDTRNDILARDLTNTVGGTDNCTVYSGVLNDPYTAQQINFVRGKETSAVVQIDHIIPLHYAITAGADKWDQQTRLEFANDPINLLAVDGDANGSGDKARGIIGKGDKGPALWMVPNNVAYRCTYAVKWVNVLDKYDLDVKAADKIMLETTLKGC